MYSIRPEPNFNLQVPKRNSFTLHIQQPQRLDYRRGKMNPKIFLFMILSKSIISETRQVQTL